MTNQIYTITEIRSILNPIFLKYNIKKAILFGSYSRQNATEKSDIDLLVDSGLRGLNFIGLLEDIRNALGKDVDVFDVMHIQPQSKIDCEIRDTGVVLYEK